MSIQVTNGNIGQGFSPTLHASVTVCPAGWQFIQLGCRYTGELFSGATCDGYSRTACISFLADSGGLNTHSTSSCHVCF